MGNIGFPTDGVPNQGWKLYITSLVMVLAAGVTVIARLATRYKFQNLGWDDLTIALSLCFSIVLSIAIQTAVVHGYGRHKADLTGPQLRAALKWFWIAQTPYKIVVALNKTTLVLLYLRIFVSRTFKISSYAVLSVVVGFGIASSFATIFQCVPIPASWDKSIDGQCIDSDKFWVANAILNIITDVMVLALPIPSIIGLHLPWRERLILCLIFLMGGFVTVTSILRVTAVQNSLANRADLTWNFITRGVWTLIEANLGIIGACLPVFKQPLRLLFPRMFATKASRANYNNYNNNNGSNTKNSSTTHSSNRYGTGSSSNQHLGRPILLSDKPSQHSPTHPTSGWKSHMMSARVANVQAGHGYGHGLDAHPPRRSDEQHIMSAKSFETNNHNNKGGSDTGSMSV